MKNALLKVALIGLLFIAPSTGYGAEHNLSLSSGDYGFKHEELHDNFYRQLNRAAGINCCNDGDCRATLRQGSEVLVDGMWCPITMDTKQIFSVPLPHNEENHVCALKRIGTKCPFIRCVASRAGS